jgi:chromosome segregation ATPase
VYTFLKNTARENEQLRKDIAKAHEERDQARQDKATYESKWSGLDPESNRIKKELVREERAIQDQRKVAFHPKG